MCCVKNRDQLSGIKCHRLAQQSGESNVIQNKPDPRKDHTSVSRLPTSPLPVDCELLEVRDALSDCSPASRGLDSLDDRALVVDVLLAGELGTRGEPAGRVINGDPPES